jgi:hypothetical protein
MGKIVSIDPQRSAQVIGPDDRFRHDDKEYAGYFVSVGFNGDVRMLDSLEDKGESARDGVTVSAGTQFFYSRRNGASLHMFNTNSTGGNSVDVEVQAFHGVLGDLEP